MSNTTAPIDESLLVTIEKLIRKSESPSATLPERELFANKAAQLMARYRIDRSMIGGRLAEDDVIGEHEYGYIAGGSYSRVRIQIISGVASAFDCQLFWRSYGNQPKRLYIFGFKSDAEMVIQLAHRLIAEADSKAGSVKGDGRSSIFGTTTLSARRGFYMGFGDEVGKRLRAATAMARAEAEMEGVDTASTDLVLVDRKKQVNEALRSKRLRNADPISDYGQRGYSAGRQAGEQANLGTSRNQVSTTRAIGS